MSNGLQLSGLVSGFDWKSFVDTMVGIERAPANRLQLERLTNNTRLTALEGLESRLADLRTAVTALATDTFAAREVTGTDSTWQSSAGAGAPPGTYRFELLQAATAARWEGLDQRAAPLAPTADVSGLTVATLGTQPPLTAGEFTVNGHRIAVELSDALSDVFDRIAAATGNAVTAEYDPLLDRVRLNSATPIMLGAANDSANFIAAMRWQDNGLATLESAGALGSVNLNAPLGQARLATAITNADGDGEASFTVNGVAIAYNLNTDSLAAIMARLEAADTGVRLSYDSRADRFTLLNLRTGDLGLTRTESGDGLLNALGLSVGASLERGEAARFRVNEGPPLISDSNTFTADSHGIAGLAVSPRGPGVSSDITVAADTKLMRDKVDTFINRFNALQAYVEDQSRITRTDDKVTTGPLANNREVQGWANAMRAEVFAAVPGLADTLNRLDHLGIDFAAGTSNLTIRDESRLTAMLTSRPADVALMFTQAGTGLVARLETRFDSYLGINGAAGLLAGQKTNLTASNTSIERQIAEIDRRLEQRRAQLEATFIAMETAQAKINQMQSQLLSIFPANSTNNNPRR